MESGLLTLTTYQCIYTDGNPPQLRPHQARSTCKVHSNSCCLSTSEASTWVHYWYNVYVDAHNCPADPLAHVRTPAHEVPANPARQLGEEATSWLATARVRATRR